MKRGTSAEQREKSLKRCNAQPVQKPIKQETSAEQRAKSQSAVLPAGLIATGCAMQVPLAVQFKSQ
jgi:hypothetical protein